MPSESDDVLPLTIAATLLAHVELQTLVLGGARSSHPFPPYTNEVSREERRALTRETRPL